jgi:hypothetical protein
MATLLLTVVGTAIGGPLGGAIGGALGSVFDREVLFRPKGREGPRLSELKLQTSSYGTALPLLFGTLRVAGSVIWATDLIEHRSTERAGKGQPSVTSYAYSASFAVALSARPILGVRRIWADGNLLRGSAGDWKVRTGFRLHPGSEDQPVDPLIAAAEGAAPAHRGLAYAVFEDMPLAEFGNRIPSLTFEVEADMGPVTLGAIAEAVSGGVADGNEALLPVGGYAAYGNARGLIEQWGEAAGLWFAPDGARVAVRGGIGDAVAVADAGFGWRAAGTRGVRSIAAAESAPRVVSVGHYDAARDYQAGVQRAVRTGPGMREVAIDLPAALDAGAAKTLAEAALARADLERERRTVALGWDALAVRAGDRVTLAGEPGQWRVAEWSLEHMVVTLELRRIAAAALPAAASAGRVLGAPDRVAGETIVHGFELPMLDDSLASVPKLLIAAAGTEPGWRKAALLLSGDGGARWQPIGGTAAPAVLGTVAVAPGAGPTTLEDRVHAIEVELAHEAMPLGDADAAALDAGGNLALVGDELLQFARAEPLGGARWRLSGLWRGRRGTDAAGHVVGERFVLLSAEALVAVDSPVAAEGSALLLASGVGDAEAVEAAVAVSGASVRPPSPVHLRVRETGDGDAVLTWVRRSRAGWRWRDGVDVPLGEETERYQLLLTPAAGPAWTVETATPEWTISAAERAGAAIHAAVRQIGAHALSPASTLTIPAWED